MQYVSLTCACAITCTSRTTTQSINRHTHEDMQYDGVWDAIRRMARAEGIAGAPVTGGPGARSPPTCCCAARHSQLAQPAASLSAGMGVWGMELDRMAKRHPGDPPL